DVSTRLWQDPLEAIQDTPQQRADGSRGSSREDPIHEVPSLIEQLNLLSAPPKVLAVMLSGLPYAEESESRLRTRIAVAAGLGRARFAPDDGDHIGFVKVHPWLAVEPQNTTAAATTRPSDEL